MTSRRGPVEKCTFCGKSRQHVESLIAGPPGINICNECVELCNEIITEEYEREDYYASRALVPKPKDIKAHLDEYIIGQDEAKRAVAIALRNRWRRRETARSRSDGYGFPPSSGYPGEWLHPGKPRCPGAAQIFARQNPG